MSSRIFTLLFVFLLWCFFATVDAQTPTASIVVNGAVEKPLQLNQEALAKLPRRTVQANNHDGKPCDYEGVELREILQRAGVPFGKELKGKWLASYALVEAADNYQVVFALPELDSLFTDRVILLADTCDGKPLPEKNGTFQVIVPDEKRHARWVRQVKSLTIVHAGRKAE